MDIVHEKILQCGVVLRLTLCEDGHYTFRRTSGEDIHEEGGTYLQVDATRVQLTPHPVPGQNVNRWKIANLAAFVHGSELPVTEREVGWAH